MGGLVLHGGVALSEGNSRGGPGLDLLLSLKSVEHKIAKKESFPSIRVKEMRPARVIPEF